MTVTCLVEIPIITSCVCVCVCVCDACQPAPIGIDRQRPAAMRYAVDAVDAVDAVCVYQFGDLFPPSRVSSVHMVAGLLMMSGMTGP